MSWKGFLPSICVFENGKRFRTVHGLAHSFHFSHEYICREVFSLSAPARPLLLAARRRRHLTATKQSDLWPQVEWAMNCSFPTTNCAAKQEHKADICGSRTDIDFRHYVPHKSKGNICPASKDCWGCAVDRIKFEMTDEISSKLNCFVLVIHDNFFASIRLLFWSMANFSPHHFLQLKYETIMVTRSATTNNRKRLWFDGMLCVRVCASLAIVRLFFCVDCSQSSRNMSGSDKRVKLYYFVIANLCVLPSRFVWQISL